MIAVFKKEFRSMLSNLIAPLLTGGILAVMFLYFFFNNLIAWSADLGVPMNATASLALTFAVPFLTMRLFAEDRAKKTEQLLLSAPVSAVRIVLGKFLAVAALLSFPAFIACLLPLILRPYGEVQYATSYTAVLGFFLYALMITAIGMFVSALTQNMFGAGIMTFLLLLLGVMMSGTYDRIGSPLLQTLLRECFDFGTRISRMMGGLFDLTSVIYFLSVCALFLFLTVQVFLKRRYDLHGEGRRAALMILGASLLAVLTCLFVNLGAAHLPEGIRTVDVTSNGLYSVTEPSKEVVRGLTDPYRIYYLAAEDDAEKDENIERILKAYLQENELLTLEYVNPVLRPSFYEAYSDTALSADSVVIVNERTGRFRALEYRDMVQTQLNLSSFTEYVTGYDAEGQITNAFARLSVPADALQKAYLLTGHGERGLDTLFTERISRTGLESEELTLQLKEQLPEDCALLILNAPAQDLTEAEADRILRYLSEGGNLLMIMDAAQTKEMPNLARIADFYGVSLLSGIVAETDPEGYLPEAGEIGPYYLLPLMVQDAVTEPLLQARNGTVFCPLSGALGFEEETEGCVTAPLLVTSEEALLTDPNGQTAEVGGEAGRFTIALRSEKEVSGERYSTAFFYACAEMFTKEADEDVALGKNSMLFGNTLNELLPEDLHAVSIPVKSYYNTLSMSANASRAFMIILGLFVPFLWVMGFALWWMRRRL